jgi:hypothetical protein
MEKVPAGSSIYKVSDNSKFITLPITIIFVLLLNNVIINYLILHLKNREKKILNLFSLLQVHG